MIEQRKKNHVSQGGIEPTPSLRERPLLTSHVILLFQDFNFSLVLKKRPWTPYPGQPTYLLRPFFSPSCLIYLPTQKWDVINGHSLIRSGLATIKWKMTSILPTQIGADPYQSSNTMEDLLLFNRNKLFQGDHIRLLESSKLLGIP